MGHRDYGVPAVIALAALAASCAAPAQTRITSAPSQGHDVPLDAPVAFVDMRRDTPRLNRFGGEIPHASPSRPVDEAGINDPTPG
ncbi:MAG: hypothetical protein GVY06_09550 [Alphaproteobacteria bacterium]|jgi:hypothetical protein|nr:hypothetical protein [Alphaproteobacteria bacterium]